MRCRDDELMIIVASEPLTDHLYAGLEIEAPLQAPLCTPRIRAKLKYAIALLVVLFISSQTAIVLYYVRYA